MSEAKFSQAELQELRNTLNVTFYANTGQLVTILCNKKRSDIEAMAEAYEEQFNRDFISDLKSKTKQDFRRVMVGISMSAARYDAAQLHEAFGGMGCDEEVITEILCTRTAEEIQAITKVYDYEHKRDLRTRIRDETSGKKPLQAVYFHMLDCRRDKGAASLVPKHISILQRGYDRIVYVQYLAGYDRNHVEQMARDFPKKTGQTFPDFLTKKAGTGPLGNAFLALSIPRERFYALKFYQACKATPVDNATMIRIICSQKEGMLRGISRILKSVKPEQMDIHEWVEKKSHHAAKRALLAIAANFCPRSGQHAHP